MSRLARSVYAFAVTITSIAAAPAAARAPVDVRHTDLGQGIHLFTVVADGYVEELNTVVVVGDRDVLVYDTQTRPSSARAILARIRELTDKPVSMVVNSHWHPDHWSGNEVFAEAEPLLEIVATEETRDYMDIVAPAWPERFRINLAAAEAGLETIRKSGRDATGRSFSAEELRAEEAEVALYREFTAEAQGVRRTPPTLTYADRLTLHRGDREIQLRSLVGDARGTTILYLPRERAVFTGDLVVYPIPYSTPSPTERVRSLRELRDLNWTVLVPGHGPAMRDRVYLDLQIELLESIVRQVRAALRAGAATLDAVQKAVDLSTLRARFAKGETALERRFDGHVQFVIGQAIREAREQDYR